MKEMKVYEKYRISASQENGRIIFPRFESAGFQTNSPGGSPGFMKTIDGGLLGTGKEQRPCARLGKMYTHAWMIFAGFEEDRHGMLTLHLADEQGLVT